MTDEEKGTVVLVMVVFFCSLALGYIFGSAQAKNSLETQAIEHNAAQYNPKTKQFEWIKK